MPGSAYQALSEVAAEQHGYVTHDDARALGIPSMTLVRMADRGTLERVSRGVYRFPMFASGPLAQYMEATLWPQGVRGVLSHETALDLHDLSDVNPRRIHITVPLRHRIQRKIPRLYVVHRADLPSGEVTRHEGIPIVTPERAVRDAHQAGVGAAIIRRAIEDGRRRGIFSEAAASQLRAETDLERAG
jgi:predicted transcriptional regulator of viral defense system